MRRSLSSPFLRRDLSTATSLIWSSWKSMSPIRTAYFCLK